jgi:hypothetical protein
MLETIRRVVERPYPQERREMKQAIIELTAAVRELAAAIKEGKEENSPTPPIRRKPKKPTTTTTTRARARFVKPTVDEVAAYVREKGYTFDPVAFWYYYESNGWKIGRNTMKSWTSACVTWQRKEGKPQTVVPEEPSEADRFLMECMAKSQAGRKESAR